MTCTAAAKQLLFMLAIAIMAAATNNAQSCGYPLCGDASHKCLITISNAGGVVTINPGDNVYVSPGLKVSFKTDDGDSFDAIFKRHDHTFVCKHHFHQTQHKLD